MRFFFLALIFLSLLGTQVRAADQCQALFGPKLYKSDKSFGKQIFKREIRELSDALSAIKSLSWNEQVNTLVDDDDRKLLFHLRVLSQTYELKDPKFFGKYEETFKNLEFLLGRVQLYKELNSMLMNLKEPGVAQIFDLQQASAIQEFKKGLKRLDLQKIEDDLSDYKWESPKKDQKFLLKEAIQFAKGLDENIRNDKYNSEDLEEGLHRLRRRLRELIYRIVNLDGLVKLVNDEELSPSLEQWYEELRSANPQMLSSAYLPKKSAEIASPYFIGAKSLAVLTEVVAEIGITKDKNESLFYIEKAIADGQFDSKTKARTLRKLRTLKAQSVDPGQVAEHYQERLRSTQLLQVIISFLEEHNL